MSDTKNKATINFTNEKEFNEITSHICSNAYTEFEKLAKLFQAVVENNGPDSFSTTLVTYNSLRKLVGLVVSRPVDDKEDMYKALAQMLYFPMSVSSELFIVAQDSRVRLYSKESLELENTSDALVVTFVTPHDCIIFTVPYKVVDNNKVIYRFEDAWISCVHEEALNDKSSPVGNMVEIFYVFSHSNTTGPFLPHEVLSFLKTSGFTYEIVNPEHMHNAHIALPIAMP